MILDAAQVLGSIFRACWQGTLLILCVGIVCRALRALPAHVRCWLWWLAAVKLLISLLWLDPIRLALLPPVRVVAPSIHLTPVQSAAGTRQDNGGPKSEVRSPESATPHRLFASSPHPAAPPVTLSPCHLVTLSAVLSLATLLLHLRAGMRTRRLVREARPCGSARAHTLLLETATAMGIARVPPLLESHEARGPLVVGLWRPAIVLPWWAPMELEESELRMALAHELAHLRRGDLWLGLIPGLACALLPFLPPAWWARRQYLAAREEACDAEALRHSPGVPAEYGRLLLKFASSGAHAGIAAALGPGPRFRSLERRLKMLEYLPCGRQPWLRPAVRLIVVAVALCLVPWRLTAQNVSPVPAPPEALPPAAAAPVPPEPATPPQAVQPPQPSAPAVAPVPVPARPSLAPSRPVQPAPVLPKPSGVGRIGAVPATPAPPPSNMDADSRRVFGAQDRARLDEAQAEVARARAEVEVARAAVTQAVARELQARAEYDRAQQLYTAGAPQLNRARASLETSHTEVQRRAESLAQAEASLDQAQAANGASDLRGQPAHGVERPGTVRGPIHEINIRPGTDRNLARVDLNHADVLDALELLFNHTGVDYRIDSDALDVASRSSVTLHLTNATVSKAARMIIEAAPELTFHVSDGVYIIGARRGQWQFRRTGSLSVPAARVARGGPVAPAAAPANQQFGTAPAPAPTQPVRPGAPSPPQNVW